MAPEIGQKVSELLRNRPLIPNGTQDSLSAALDTTENFGNSSGLKSNGKKSEALLIMSLVGNRENLCPKKNIKWPENRIKFIGAWISTDLTCTKKLNCRRVEQKNTGDYQKDEIS